MESEQFLSDVEVRVPNLVVVTADDADERIHRSVQEVLRLLRDVKGIDVVFVADMTECGRHLAYDNAPAGARAPLASAADSVEALWGEQVLAGRAAAAGRPIHSRIVSPSGRVYGMLCSTSARDSEAGVRVDQRMLRHTAALTARKIEERLHEH